MVEVQQGLYCIRLGLKKASCFRWGFGEVRLLYFLPGRMQFGGWA